MFFKKSTLKHKTAYKNKKRGGVRGFTLAETALALAVISITCVGALSLILSAQRATMSAAQKQQAQLFAADIVNCFRVSDTYGDFEDNLEFALGLEETALQGVLQDNEQDIQIKDMIATVTIDTNTLKVTVKNDRKDLAEMQFTKGVALREETP